MRESVKAAASVSKMSEILGVSRSGYYAWLTRPESKSEARRKHILEKIQSIHSEFPAYGLDALWHEVLKTFRCSRELVHKLMRKNNIRSIRKPKWKATTNSKHNLPVMPNLLLRERTLEERIDPVTGQIKEKYERIFNYPRPNMVWVGDITYNWTDEGWLYTAVVKDLCSKEVVGYAMSDRIDRNLVIKAMNMAIKRERPPKGLIFHSDRGSQYCSDDYQKLLRAHGIQPSMSRKGIPYDNAVAENFFSNMKCECTNFLRFKTRDQAKLAIFEYIEIYYNRKRLHSSLGWMTPFEFKMRLLAA